MARPRPPNNLEAPGLPQLLDHAVLQRARAPATHAPDTEPGKRDTDAGTRTDGRKVLPSLSEVGAGCGKAARPDLCGGTGATRFPTAITNMSPEVLVASRPDASGRATSAPPPARQHRLVMPIVRDGRGAVKPGPTGHRPRRQGLDGASPAAARSTKRSMDPCRSALNTPSAAGDISIGQNLGLFYR